MSDQEAPPVIVATIPKNSREDLQFALTTFKGHRLVSVRAWTKKEDGTAIPTKSGINIRVSLLADVQKALTMVAQAARDAGWLEGGR